MLPPIDRSASKSSSNTQNLLQKRLATQAGYVKGDFELQESLRKAAKARLVQAAGWVGDTFQNVEKATVKGLGNLVGGLLNRR